MSGYTVYPPAGVELPTEAVDLLAARGTRTPPVPSLSEESCALLRRTLEHVLAHPDEHDQTSWGLRLPCGTSYCLAGHAVVTVLGARPVWFPCADGGVLQDVVMPGTSEVVGVADAARDALGLPTGWANLLFSARNSRADLAEAVHRVTGGRVDLRAAASDGRRHRTFDWEVA